MWMRMRNWRRWKHESKQRGSRWINGVIKVFHDVCFYMQVTNWKGVDLHREEQADLFRQVCVSGEVCVAVLLVQILDCFRPLQTRKRRIALVCSVWQYV